MKQYLLPDRTLFLWRVRLSAAAGLLSALPAWLWAALPGAGLAAVSLLCLIWAAALIALFWYLPRYRRNYRITLNERSLLLQRGVFVHTQYLLPAPRMIYAELTSTPLCRALGLSGLSLRAARSGLRVAPLPLREATELLCALDRAEDCAEDHSKSHAENPAKNRTEGHVESRTNSHADSHTENRAESHSENHTENHTVNHAENHVDRHTDDRAEDRP